MKTNYITRDHHGMYAGAAGGPGPALMGSDTLMANQVYNRQGEGLGDIQDFMIDMATGQIGYAVLAFGQVQGLDDKLFAVPWSALALDTGNRRFTLDKSKADLQSAPHFVKDAWPWMADEVWAQDLHRFYGTEAPAA